MNTTCLLPLHRRETGDVFPVGIGIGAMKATRSRTFKKMFCQRFKCSPEDYESRLFWGTLHRHAFPVAGLLSRMDPEFFREDEDLIRELAAAASHKEVIAELNRFFGRNVRDRNWLRKWFSLRISGKRVLKLSRKVFAPV
jgi:hypothetical protein